MAITECRSELTKALCPFDNQKCMDTKSPLPMKPCNYGMFARAGGGKTTLLLNLLMKKESPWYKHFDLIFLISPTAANDDKMQPLIEDIEDRHYEDLNNDVLEDILAKIEAYKERHERKKRKGKPIFCIIYDDCIHQIKGKNASLVTKFATTARHLYIVNIYLLQKYNSYMPTLIRSNLTVTSFFHTENEGELDSFIKEQSGSEHKLRALYNFATATPYSFLHINSYSQPTRYFRCFDPIEYREKKASK
jgi:hypothetical protein